MEIKKSHRIFAMVGVTAIAISAGWASLNNNNQENMQNNIQNISQCVSGFQENLNDIDKLHALAKGQAKSFAILKKQDENVALDLAMDVTSSVSDGMEARALAKNAEKTMLRNVGTFTVELDKPDDNSQIIQLCENSKIQANIKEARELITENTNAKTDTKKVKLK